MKTVKDYNLPTEFAKTNNNNNAKK